MKKFLLVLLMTIGINSSAMAQMFVAADGGFAPDGSLNYVFSAGSSFVSGPHLSHAATLLDKSAYKFRVGIPRPNSECFLAYTT